MEGHTPDSLLALHDAGYREVIARLGPGRVLDVGCGVGRRDRAPRRPRPTGRRRRLRRARPHALAADGRGRAHRHATSSSRRWTAPRSASGPASFDAVCSSHIIEHFMGPELHVAELARVCARRRHDVRHHARTDRPTSRTRSTCTCSRRTSSRSMLRLFFDDVEVVGLEGDAELKADFAARRASGEKLLKLDALEPAPAHAAQLVRLELRARAAGRVQARSAPRRAASGPASTTRTSSHAGHHPDDPGAVRRRPLAPPVPRPLTRDRTGHPGGGAGHPRRPDLRRWALLVDRGSGVRRPRAGHHCSSTPTCRPLGDASAYHLLANHLADGRGYIRPFDLVKFHLVVPTAEYPPLLPFVLSLLARSGCAASRPSASGWR